MRSLDAHPRYAALLRRAGLSPGLVLTRSQQRELGAADTRHRDRLTAIASQRTAIVDPILERKVAEGDVVILPASGSSPTPADAPRRNRGEHWGGRMREDPLTGERRMVWAVVGPGENAELDRLALQTELENAAFRAEVARIVGGR
jgi:hypothetical protein